jgi:two-component system response regulator AtoC
MNSSPFSIFVIEDNEWYNRLLVHQLSLNPDFEIRDFHNGKEALDAISACPDLVTLDYRLSDMNGEEVLKKIKERSPNTEVIIISEQEEIETAVELLKLGAFDYLVKSNDIKDRLHNSIKHIREHAGLKKEVAILKKEVQKKFGFEKSIIGQSPAIKKVFNLLDKAVQTNITVTVTGETGTGKEVVAKAIHYNSKLKDQPFVAVNMAAIPAELIESELFGHEKGAFTGATTRRIGKLCSWMKLER